MTEDEAAAELARGEDCVSFVEHASKLAELELLTRGLEHELTRLARRIADDNSLTDKQAVEKAWSLSLGYAAEHLGVKHERRAQDGRGRAQA